MILALGLHIKKKDKDLGVFTNSHNDEAHILDASIGHYCYSGDEDRSLHGVKLSQIYYINDSNLKAVEKVFSESIENINGKDSTVLQIVFNYFNWPLYDESGVFISQDIGSTKIIKRRLTEKQVFNRRRKQRNYSIKDLESLGFKLERMGEDNPTLYPQLVNYSLIMGRIFKRFQLDINSFIDVKSEDFKNGILSELEGTDEQLKTDLNTMIPTYDELGNHILIETWKGIYVRL